MINTVSDLKANIQQLEIKQSDDKKLLIEQFHTTLEGFKISNIVKSSFKGFIAKPGLLSNIANTAIGLTTGIIAKKLYIGKRHNIFTKLLGMILEFTVAKKVSDNAEEIKTSGNNLLNKIIDTAVKQEPVNNN